jgi:hypothetical protein
MFGAQAAINPHMVAGVMDGDNIFLLIQRGIIENAGKLESLEA